MMRILLSGILVLGLCRGAAAGVWLDAEHNALRVTDYPPEAPCDLPRLAAVDRAFGWNRVNYDAATHACYLTGDLIIGANDGSETVLTVGAAERPNEKLVVKGNLYIHPYFVEGENPGKYWTVPKLMNALVLGDATNRAITAALQFDCSPSNRFTLCCGLMPWIKANAPGQYGGGLYVYNSRIAPVNPAPGHEIGDAARGYMRLMGSAVFDGATLSGVQNVYGMSPGHKKDYLIRNTTFEHIGAMLAAPPKASGCTFTGCGTAIVDQGGLNADLNDCVFKDNDRNWSLIYTDKGLTLTDCTWAPSRLGDLHRACTNRQGVVQRPKISVRRHVQVEVVDAAGKPVSGATVSFRAEQEGCNLLQNRVYKTGKDGRTPGQDQENAMVLTEQIKSATAVPDKPETKSFTYTITAEKTGKNATVENIVPDKSWKIIILTLK